MHCCPLVSHQSLPVLQLQLGGWRHSREPQLPSAAALLDLPLQLFVAFWPLMQPRRSWHSRIAAHCSQLQLRSVRAGSLPSCMLICCLPRCERRSRTFAPHSLELELQHLSQLQFCLREWQQRCLQLFVLRSDYQELRGQSAQCCLHAP